MSCERHRCFQGLPAHVVGCAGLSGPVILAGQDCSTHTGFALSFSSSSLLATHPM